MELRRWPSGTVSISNAEDVETAPYLSHTSDLNIVTLQTTLKDTLSCRVSDWSIQLGVCML